MTANLEIVHKMELLSKQMVTYTLNHKQLNTISQWTIKQLGVKNINELRDKFEGVAYFNKMNKKYKCLVALENILKANIVDWNVVEANPNILLEKNLTKKAKIEITDFDFNSFPIVKKNTQVPTYLMLLKGEKTVNALGYIDKEIYNNQENFSPIRKMGSVDSEYHYFICLEKTKPIKK